MLRAVVESGYRTNAPLMVVDWTNEEGSRFPPAMLCSGVYAGVFTTEYAYTRTDRAGVTFGDALRSIGYLGDTPPGAIKFGAMFELHIEQGPILEAESREIGVVTGVQGMRWYEVTLKGQTSHTGTTPMSLRKDALLGAARTIDAVNRIGCAHVPGVASVGLIECRPNSRNTVPGEVFFTVDLRHPHEDVLDDMERRFRSELLQIMKSLGLEVEERQI
ncbi:MAG: hydantoinase/carbamoylase family amidase, partial [Actinomycetota bacterium]